MSVMSWDDDDFDVEEELAQNEKKAQEAEMTIDDIEEAERKKAEAEAAAAPKQKKKDKKKEEDTAAEDVPYDLALEDPVAEKLRRQKLVEEADARMAADLFSGVSAADEAVEKAKAIEAEKKEKEAAVAAKKAATKAKIEVRDAFVEYKLTTQADVEKLLADCLAKIETGKAKGAAPLFMTHLVKALEVSLSSEELTAFDKLIAGMVKDKKVEKTAADTAKRKTNEKMSKNTKFDTGKEIAEVYGGGGDYEEWDEDEWWDEGTAATAAEYAAPKR